jgi:membrane-bound lytic murein transglycosylase F
LAHVATAFELGEPQAIAWAFGRAGDGSLRLAINGFLQQFEEDGSLRRLRARYFGHARRLNFVDTRDFWRHTRDRLPKLMPYFEEAAEKTGIDWRLLAAIGYQESHWRPDAVSPTGVRGIMMLTQATAKQMEIEDRNDPQQSIIGGARYLRVVEKKIPDRIEQPDRLWLTLAGYNIGFGHLEDARVLTDRDGADPDQWLEVKQRLPLLSKRKFYQTVRHGKARGREPVTYVDNIRNYYDLLIWYTTTSDRATRDRLLLPDNG